ncbi:polyphenol oxidase B, chloroplastic-like [Solanum lycopersicum]|uniref:polyphenol oxidase B, chloroplastic-like n=1 Tax=Solanum lycopersicum TaxID=4081 RepID=UPI003749610E
MASSSILSLCATNIPSSFSNNTNSSFLSKPSQVFLHGRRSQSFNVSCNANNNSSEHEKNNVDDVVDRRNVLLGLGGLYSATNLAPLATAAPSPSPDFKSCSTTTITGGPAVKYTCCPPPLPKDTSTIPFYEFPPMNKLRMRSPAHLVDEEYIAKYNLAISRMKALDKTEPDKPLGFKQQANIHCAYCNGAYNIGGKELQVHNSWLFFPFHRWYLYFYERILGKLIDHPTFALPYWNWDNPKGMRLPPMFDREGTSLYDERRNPQVRNGTVMDLGTFGDTVDTTQLLLQTNNLILMYHQMVSNAPCPLLFFGGRYVLGTNIEAPGTIEKIPHIPVHIWTGTVRDVNAPKGKPKYGEDMGNFYSAGLDPVFYCHHGNVDRMWNEWKTLGGKRTDLVTEPDLMNSEFFFYDENKKPYLVKVGDCLDTKKMGYDYVKSPTPWRDFKPNKNYSSGKLDTSSVPPASKIFPIFKLDVNTSFSLDRPASLRTQVEKDNKEEILTFSYIKYDSREYIRFDVYLNADKNVKPEDLNQTEYAESYTSLPHTHKPGDDDHVSTATLQLAITELLKENGLEKEDKIVVTLVPRKGGEGLAIGCVEIALVDC